MRSALLLVACLVCSGCTRIAFTAPLGTPAPASGAKELRGEWTGGKGLACRVEQDPASGQMIARVTEDGKEESRTIVLTTVGKDVFIVWAQDKELGAYLPFRIAAGDEAVALLYPDEDAVKRLVAEGKLTGAYSKEKNAWVITKCDSESLLAAKEFWRLDVSMPFIRNKAPVPSTAASPPPAGEPRHP
jgi:hypothetical protein